jgi:hypothetical protein
MYSHPLAFDVTAFGSVVNLDDSAGQRNIIYPPCPITVVQFGMVVSEAFASTVESFKLTLQYHARAEWDDTTPDSGTAIASITPTLASGAAIGNILLYTGASLPFQVNAGRIISVTWTDGGSSVAGSVLPFVIYRVDGLYDPKAANTFGFAA